MRIVLYSHSARLGGAELAAPALAEQLGAELWTRAIEHVAEASGRGVQSSVLPKSLDRRPRGVRNVLRAGPAVVGAQWSLWRALAQSNVDVAIANNVQGVLHLAVGCLLTRTPLVVYVRDLGRGGNRSRLEVGAYLLILKLAARGCIFNSELTRTSWHLGRSVQSVVVPTAVPNEFYDRPRRVREGEILMLGRIARWKGQDQVVRAAEIVHRSIPVHLRLVGGALFGDDVDLPRHTFPLEVTGHRERPWEELETAAVLVHASLTPEPFGQVLAQAAAAGVPIVCSDTGGQMEWLEDGVSCLAVDPHDERALAAAILSTLQQPEAGRRRALAARERASAFREDVAYEAVKDWIRRIL